MTTAVSTLIEKARRRVNEESTTFFEDDDFVDWADEAQKYFVRQTRYLEGSSHTSTVSGQANYALPSDFLALQRLKYDGKKIDRISFLEIDELNLDEADHSGTPTGYYIMNGQLYLFPIPNSVATMRLYYYKIPVTLDVTSDTLETPPIYDDVIVCYMCYMAYKKDAESDISSLDFADYWMTECNVKIQQIKSDMQEDKLDRPVMFIPKRGYRLRTPLRDWK